VKEGKLARGNNTGGKVRGEKKKNQNRFSKGFRGKGHRPQKRKKKRISAHESFQDPSKVER